jgi:transcriptional regulator with XRE-family HTH domain
VATLARDWREARLAAGLSQAVVARAAGLSRETYGRFERGAAVEIGLSRAAVISSVLGTDLSVKLYVGASPIRDAGHVRLLQRFDERVPAAWGNRHEAPMGIPGDRRAWDRRLDGQVSIGVEAETGPRDLQAIERAMNLKRQDSGVTRMILLVADTSRNRRLLREYAAILRSTFPLSTREVLQALRDGRDPGASGIVVL